jgi:M6 family metalloprotease-like protein
LSDGAAATQEAAASQISQAGATPSNLKHLVVLLRFANHVDRQLPAPADYDILFNYAGPHPLAPTGSVRDLYLENSYGAFELNSTVFAWVTVSNTEQYYAASKSGLDSRLWEALSEALDLVDTGLDFSQLDSDGNGYIDNAYH